LKWNETHRIGAIFACFCIARVCQRHLGFLVNFILQQMLSLYNWLSNEKLSKERL